MFTTVDLGSYRFKIPEQWEYRAYDGARAKSLHTRPEPGVALDLQVLEGLAQPDCVDALLAMHRRAWAFASPPPLLDLPIAPSIRLSLSLQQGDSRVSRELHVYGVNDDLLAGTLTWSKAPQDLRQRPSGDRQVGRESAGPGPRLGGRRKQGESRVRLRDEAVFVGADARRDACVRVG